MASRVCIGAAFLAALAFSEDAKLESALASDDACRAGSEECSVELRQLRGEVNSAQAIIAKQLEENKKYEVALDDDSGTVCKAPKGYKTTGMSCGGATKCCTSQPSYVAGTPHSAQAHLSLYSICCSVNDHCKYDTIFVSCAPGPGPDDYSGVIAGLQEDVQTNEQPEGEVQVEQNDEADGGSADELGGEGPEETSAQNDEADGGSADELGGEGPEEMSALDDEGDGGSTDELEDEGAVEMSELEQDTEVTGGKCMNKHDLKIWKSGGKQQYDAAMDHCGTSCAAGFPCTRDCMKKHGYSTGCASCMAHAVECGRDKCLSQCISNHKSKACLHCNKKSCRPVMKRCSGWAVGGH